MSISLQDSPIEPWLALSNHQQNNNALAGQFGATNIFLGTMRDMNMGSEVNAMLLEHYPEMTRRCLEHIEAAAQQKYQLLDSLIIHRFGEIQPNDTIVVIGSWATHRNDAFLASRFMLEELKHRAPFWKKETLHATGNSRWVESNTGQQDK